MKPEVMKTKAVSFRLREQEFALLQEAADAAGKPLSEWARETLVHLVNQQPASDNGNGHGAGDSSPLAQVGSGTPRRPSRTGWSRNVLVLQIESGLCRRQGKALTNFQRTLANHESARTTGLYDRRDDTVSLDEVEDHHLRGPALKARFSPVWLPSRLVFSNA